MFHKRFLLAKVSYQNFAHNYQSKKLKHQWIKPEGYDTGIRVYNRVAGKKVPLIVRNKNYVKWYLCGPTVYDVSHMGHASSYIRFDILNRILRQFFDVNAVVALGITDIDDKIIVAAKKQNVDFRKLTKKYELEFLSQINELNILPPSFILRVSDHIPEIIEFVSKIIKRGRGYAIKDGSVYFNGELSKDLWKLNMPQEEGSSPLKEGQKSFLDFALWKKAKKDEPFWESPWGQGRPGWHIECSAMASKVFGSELDLHGGGIDLAFPHHENEEFQSCSYHDCNQWVNYWLHTGHLLVKEEKMSKSLNNFISISDFLEKYTSDNLRMLCFITHYRRGLQYSLDGMEMAVSACNTFSRLLADSFSYIKGNWTRGNISEASLLQELEETSQKMKEHLSNDFDTSKCYLSLMQLAQNTLKDLNKKSDASVSRSPGAVAAVSCYIENFFKSLGFHFGTATSSQATSNASQLEFVVDQAVNFRTQVREGALSSTEKPVKQTLLKACDSIRNELETVGIEIKDLGNNSSSWSFADVKKKPVERPQAESKV